MFVSKLATMKDAEELAEELQEELSQLDAETFEIEDIIDTGQNLASTSTTSTTSTASTSIS